MTPDARHMTNKDADGEIGTPTHLQSEN